MPQSERNDVIEIILQVVWFGGRSALVRLRQPAVQSGGWRHPLQGFAAAEPPGSLMIAVAAAPGEGLAVSPETVRSPKIGHDGRGHGGKTKARMTQHIVVIGGGPAAVFAAIAAKKRDPAASVTLVTDEVCEPYEKPPLSKAVQLGKADPEDAPIAGPGGLAAHGVVLKPGGPCSAIDRAAREAVVGDGRLPYDALVLATGSLMRELPLLPPGMPRVHYLRTDRHARALRAALTASKHLVVIGAGLIGLEVAASAAELGIEVTVIEIAPRIMARACDEETGAAILAEHQHHGVEFVLSQAVTQVTPQLDGSIAIETGDGDLHIADHIVVGAGIVPNTRLAAAAGLAVADGIVVDAQCRTSDPTIFAAGDATCFPGPQGPVRLENWRHAQDHGAVAGRNAAGLDEAYNPVPSYWSEQYDLYIQGVGWPNPSARKVRRPLPGKSTLMLEIKDGVVSHALGINTQRDLAAIRRLIERRIPVEPDMLADPAQPFQAMLKAKTS
jgi:NADPH-dependent 2,4-dienoyl-CoA reductase/sulfur reductase-like enzyme